MILVVEDNETYRRVVVASLSQYLQGIRIFEASSVKEARRALDNQPVQVVVVDMTLPDGTAITLLEDSQDFIRQGLKVIVFSNHAREDMLPLLDRRDVHAYVEKTQGPRQLALAIQAVFNGGARELPSSP